jgi:hypothetical protein
MNYIKHLTGFFDKVVQDDRLNPTHISLYIALFQFWNVQRFKNPISISRDEVMRVSKICSKATYHKCMKDLHNYKYVNYDPSYNPFRGSLITLFDLELKAEHIKKRTKNTTKKQTPTEQALNKKETAIETSDEQALVPYINNINNTNIINTKNDLNIDSEQNEFCKSQKKEKVKKEILPSAVSKNVKFIAPTIEFVQEYFKEKNKPDIEAQKFFNYFESNGWKIGGRSPMKNWQAAANNWMLNSNKFNQEPKPQNLHITQDKDYSIPL